MRKKIVAGLAVVVLALAGIGGWYWWDVLRFRQSTDDAYVQSDVTLISPKIEGYIKKVKVADNQQVAEGATLFVIDDRDFKAKAAQAEAAVATTEATVATYESRLKLQQAMIDQAAAVVHETEWEELSGSDLEIQRRLLFAIGLRRHRGHRGLGGRPDRSAGRRGGVAEEIAVEVIAGVGAGSAAGVATDSEGFPPNFSSSASILSCCAFSAARCDSSSALCSSTRLRRSCISLSMADASAFTGRRFIRHG